ncbi:MAG: phosphotransferase family protein [Deltaproteobacteria bacterium]|nr:phosphotransferase family protein [Deltaproteobacteria bacterium]
MTAAELAEGLASYLTRVTGGPVAVAELRQLPGGASRETWAFEATFDGESCPRRLVLRRDPGQTSVDSDRAHEFHVLRAAHASDVPVPRVHWLGDDAAVLGARFFIMDYVAGETLARRLLRDPEYAGARRVMARQLGAILARIHAIDVAAHGLEFLAAPPAGRSPAAAEIARYEQLYRSLAPEPHPVIELALRWLDRHAPAARRQTLVHGDYRIGNVLFDHDGVRAILDWELAHRGDPMEDLGWMCVKAWRFGSPLPVGGVGERRDLFAAYEEAGGGPVDTGAVHFWEVFGNMKWAVICIAQAHAFLDGGVPSLELASLGRRTAEVEHELVRLID